MLKFIFIFGAEYLYLIVGAVFFVWFLRQSRPKQKEIIILTGMSLFLVFISSTIADHLFYNPRPFVVGHFTPLIPHKPDNGFPSDHVSLLSTIASVVFIFNRRLSVLFWVLALFVGVSRVYVGVHHPIDIIGSIIIATTMVILSRFVMTRFKKS